MLKIQLPDDLRAKVTAASTALPEPSNKPGLLATAALVAEQVIKHYSVEVPKLFASHAAPFFRDVKHAVEIGGTTDAAEALIGLRTRASNLQTAPAAPENINWLKNIFDCALSGQLHLRMDPHEL